VVCNWANFQIHIIEKSLKNHVGALEARLNVTYEVIVEGVIMHICNPSTLQAEVWRTEV
jgi:hypothetical protein